MEEDNWVQEMLLAVKTFLRNMLKWLVNRTVECGDWCKEVNSSKVWQDRVFYTLAALYGFFAAISLIQLARSELRVTEYGWTIGKVFRFLNVIVNGVRSVVFVFFRSVQLIKPEIFQYVLLDIPGLLFITTYGLWLLFWAENFYENKAPDKDIRRIYMALTVIVYLFQICIWIYLSWSPSPFAEVLSKEFFAVVSFLTASGFLYYGVRLFFKVLSGSLEREIRHKKAGYVSTICFTCFLIRSIWIEFCADEKDANPDVLNHPILIFIYYMVVEIIPSSLILFIPQKLLPKPVGAQPHLLTYLVADHEDHKV